ncbi:MAG: hypothetical protein RR400_04150 [Clostridia bacterium]
MLFFDTLRNYRRIKSQIWSCVIQEQELRELGGFPNTGANEGMPKSPNCAGDNGIMNFLSKLQELDEKKKALEFSLDCVRNDLMRFLENLEDYSTRQVVEIKIFATNKLSWEEVAKKIMYSVPHTRNLYKEGMKKLEVMEL